MQINETVETTRIISAIVSLEDIKAVAIGAVKRQAGIGDDLEVASSEADVDGKGGIVVKIVVKQPKAVPIAEQPGEDKDDEAELASAPAALMIPSAPSNPPA